MWSLTAFIYFSIQHILCWVAEFSALPSHPPTPKKKILLCFQHKSVEVAASSLFPLSFSLLSHSLSLSRLTLLHSYDSCHHSSAGFRSAFQGLQVHRFTRFCLGRQHRQPVSWWVPPINNRSCIHSQQQEMHITFAQLFLAPYLQYAFY